MTEHKRYGPPPTPRELMIAAAATELSGARTAFVGIGEPNVAANVARRTVAPDLEIIYESGTIGSQPERQPSSIADPAVVSGAAACMPMHELFAWYLQAGRIEVGVLGAAQIDIWGNLNTTVIGQYHRPRVRMPGSGGACEIALNARRTIVVMHQSPRTFVDRVDFVTSPGRRAADGRPRPVWAGLGPTAVITQLALYRFGTDGEMELAAVQPGVSEDDLESSTSLSIRRQRRISTLPEPSADMLRLMRMLVPIPTGGSQERDRASGSSDSR